MRDLTNDFKNKDELWRVEAVIHDGSWYTIKKWAKVAKVKEDVVKEYIANNVPSRKNDKFEKLNDSYRAKYDEIIHWYSLQDDITIEDKIIPNNYPPRLWGGMTEVESFQNAPLRDTSTITFETQDDELLKKCILALSGVARVRLDKGGKYRAYGLSNTYIRQVLTKSLTSEEMKALNVKRRTTMRRRELTDFSPEFVEEAIQFYIPFTRNVLKNHMSTIKLFLPDTNEIDSQITIWIIEAMRKFDESLPIPFSGYLNSVMRFWPYNLPDEMLGKELSSFQREKQKAIQALTVDEEESGLFSNEDIAEQMNIDFKKYIQLNSEHEAWVNERNSTELNWSDSSNEKTGTLVGANEEKFHDRDLSNSISIALIKSAINTEDFESAGKVITSMDANSNNDLSYLSDIDEAFKASLASELVNLGVLP